MVSMPVRDKRQSGSTNYHRFGNISMKSSKDVRFTYLIFEDNSPVGIIVPRMDPRFSREKQGPFTETANDDLHQMDFLAVKIGNENGSG